MGTIILNHKVAGAGNTDVIQCTGGIRPGVIAGDALGTAPMAFNVTALGATAFSYVTQSFAADSYTIGQTTNVLGQVIKELIRKGILSGTYAV